MSEVPRPAIPEKDARKKVASALRGGDPHAFTDVPRTFDVYNEDIPAPHHLVRLATFEDLCDTPFAEYYLDAKDLSLMMKMTNPTTKNTDEPVDKEKMKKVKQRIDSSIYTKIKEEFGLESEKESHNFFQDRWNDGLTAIKQHSQLVYGQPAAINDELKLQLTPSRLIQLLVSEYVAPELKKQIKTNLLLARIASEITFSAQGSKKKLDDMLDLFNEKLYIGQTGETVRTNRFGIFTSKNDLIGIPQEVKPKDEEIPQGTHYKFISANTRTVELNGKPISVVQMYNTKSMSTSIEKALRKTLDEGDNNNGEDQVQSAEYVKDVNRMMFVVYGSESDAEALRQRIGDLVLDNYDHFGTNTPEDIKVKDESKSHHIGKSDDYKRICTLFSFKDVHLPIEVIIQTLPQYIRGQFNIGTYDPNSDTISGQSHAVMEKVRAKALKDLLSVFQPPTEFNPKPAGSKMSYHRPTQVQRTIAEQKRIREITLG